MFPLLVAPDPCLPSSEIQPHPPPALLPFDPSVAAVRTPGATATSRRDRDRYDPARHGWYRSADRGYNSRYGSREDYRSEYREGFLAGYEEAYGRDNSRTRSGSRRPSWWPF